MAKLNLNGPRFFIHEKRCHDSMIGIFSSLFVVLQFKEYLDNETAYLIIYCLNSIRRDGNSTYKKDLTDTCFRRKRGQMTVKSNTRYSISNIRS